MSMLDLHYCRECREKLEDCGEFALELFELICMSYIVEEPFIIVVDYSGFSFMEVVKYLELKGFVMTTESGISNIAVKPFGLQQIEEEVFTFCLEHKD